MNAFTRALLARNGVLVFGRYLCLGFYLVCASLPMTGQVAAQEESPGAGKPLRVCLDPNNAPFSMKQGKRHGVYYDMAVELATALDRPFQVNWWSTRSGGGKAIRLTVLAGKCEAIMGVPFGRDFMESRLWIAGPLLDLAYVIVLPEEAAADSLQELAGKRVAVVFETPAQSVLATHPKIHSVSFREPEQALAALANGKADAAFVWSAFAVYEIRSASRDWRILRDVRALNIRWQSGIGVARENRKLYERLQKLLETKRGEIKVIADSYGLHSGNGIATSGSGETTPKGAKNETSSGGKKARDGEKKMSAKEQWGRELFNAGLGCAHCHGSDARAPDHPRDLRLLKSRYGDDWKEMYMEAVQNGRIQSQSGLVMPAWQGKVSHDKLEAIRTYLDTLQE